MSAAWTRWQQCGCEKQSDSRFILKSKSMHSVAVLGAETKKTGFRNDSNDFDLNNWKDEVHIN